MEISCYRCNGVLMTTYDDVGLKEHSKKELIGLICDNCGKFYDLEETEELINSYEEKALQEYKLDNENK